MKDERRGGRGASGRRRGAWAGVGLLVALGAGATALGAGTAGTLDTTFAGGAGVAEATDGTFTVACDLVGLSDGRLVAGGYRQSIVGTESRYEWTFRAWNADGSDDAGFGTGGVVHLFGTAAGDWLFDTAVDAADRVLGCGKIARSVTVVSGKKSQTTTTVVGAVVRLTPSGALDTSFGSGGVVTLSMPSAFGTTGAIALAVTPVPGDRVLVVGTTTRSVKVRGGSVVTPYTFLAMLDGNGSPVGSFGTGGYVVDQRDSGGPQSGVVAVDAAGGYAYVGHQRGYDPTKYPTGEKWAVSRFLLSTGAADTAFGSGGTVVSSGDVVRAVGLDSSGRLVASGNHVVSGGTTIRVTRYDTQGGVDWTTTIAPYPSQGTSGSFAFDSLGNIVLPVMVGSSTHEATALRLASDGSVDASFGTGGFAVALAMTSTVDSSAVVIAGDGGILLGGRVFQANPSPPNSSWLFLARYLPN